MAEEVQKVLIEKVEAGLQKKRETEHRLEAAKAKLSSMHPVNDVVESVHQKAEVALKEVREVEAVVKDAVEEVREKASDKYSRWRPALEFSRLHPVVSSAGVATAVAAPLLCEFQNLMLALIVRFLVHIFITLLCVIFAVVLFKSRYVVKPALLSGLVTYAGIKSSSFFYTHIVSDCTVVAVWCYTISVIFNKYLCVSVL